MRRLALVFALVLSAGPARRSAAQETRARFEIVAVRDTTIVFARGSAQWIRPGLAGVIVDPRRRDALVGRFSVLSVAADSVHALVTGQTTPLSTDHVAILAVPGVAWLRRHGFWFGSLLGAVIGATAGYLIAR